MVLRKVAAKRAQQAAAAADSASGSSTPVTAAVEDAVPLIECRAQQSRFWTDTLTSGIEIDLKDVSITVGKEHRELLTNAHVRLKEGVRYGLVGRNGTGKSTLFKALAEKLIPGINPTTRILLLSQVEDTVRGTVTEDLSVLEHVVNGDKELVKARERHKALTTAVESTSPLETARIVRELELEDRERDLVSAQLLALRRSGQRGKTARDEEIEAERVVEEARRALENVTLDTPDCLATANDMLESVQTTLDLLENSTASARAAHILVGLGFSQEMIEWPYRALSGGWRSRCSLATSLLVQSDVLLLDEVTNFLDLEATIWLEHYLCNETRTLVVTSHDTAFLSAVVEETIILRKQQLKYFEGTPAAFEANEKHEFLRATRDQAALDKKRSHVEASIRKGKASAKATGDENRSRMVKSREKKLEERWGLEQSAKGGRFKLNRDLVGYYTSRRGDIEIEAPERDVKIKLDDPPALRTLGDLVHFDHVEFRHPRASKPLLADITFTVEQGGRLAFVGANGQGKSTLAKLIMGELQPTRGSIVRHPLLKIGYFSQHSVEDLTSAGPMTALSYFVEHFAAQGVKVEEQAVRACLGSLGLGGRLASDVPLDQLSGGQKVRLAFALIVFHPPPLLLLDEVTTHVDFATVKALALALRNWSGAVILITHDRWLSRVVVEGESLKVASGVEDAESESASESDSEEEMGSKRGETWRVGNGKIKLMEKGMQGYVAMVERKVARRMGT
ncbi:hypothetical protein JCM10908_000108 [Rhodotorula pacifica]|uniref:ABC-F family ATP-binding cassette domain-containing protein n=1 Tax=Rhodotorula pacifica TaxID=1495444 RepID=UPI0031812AAC